MKVVKRSSAKKFLIETILTNVIYKDMGGARSYGFTKVETLKRLSTVDELDLCILGLNGGY